MVSDEFLGNVNGKENYQNETTRYESFRKFDYLTKTKDTIVSNKERGFLCIKIPPVSIDSKRIDLLSVRDRDGSVHGRKLKKYSCELFTATEFGLRRTQYEH